MEADRMSRAEYLEKLHAVYEALRSLIRGGRSLNRSERLCCMVHPNTYKRVELLAAYYDQTISATVDNLLKLGLHRAEVEIRTTGEITEDTIKEIERFERVSDMEREEGITWMPGDPVDWIDSPSSKD